MSQQPDHLSKLLLEADGLLLLLHKHRDETPIDAIKLLRRKLELILTLTEGLDEEFDEPEHEPEAEEPIQCQESTADYIEDTIESAPDHENEETIREEETEAVTDNTDTVIENAEEPADAFVNEPVYEPLPKNDEPEVVEYDPNYEFVEMTAETVVTDMEPQAPVFIDRDDEPAAVWGDEPGEKSAEVNEEPESVPYRRTYVITDNQFDRNNASSNTIFQEPAPTRRPVSSVFNLNDKFRFRRELFGNSDAQYVECLDLLSAMSSIDEAKDYLYEDLNWDPDNEDVKAFVELLTNYYK